MKPWKTPIFCLLACAAATAQTATMTFSAYASFGLVGATATVTFSDAGSTLGAASLNSSGVAQLPIATSGFAKGTTTLTATYAGSGSTPAGSGTLSIAVD